MLPNSGGRWRLIAFVTIAVCGAAVAYCGIDWARYRDAIPPREGPDTADVEDVTVEKILIDSADVLQADCILKCGTKAEITILAAVDASKWRWNRFGLDNATKVAMKAEESLPQAMFQVQFLRHSSLAPGRIICATCGSPAKRASSKQLRFSSGCKVPNEPGTYLVEVMLKKQYLTKNRLGQLVMKQPVDEVLLATFEVSVEK